MAIDNWHFANWRKYQVQAASLQDFLASYYKHDRYKGQGEEYAACILESHQDTLREYGCDWISKYESTTGEVVSYYPEP